MSSVRFILFVFYFSLSVSCHAKSDDAGALLAFKNRLTDPAKNLASWKNNSRPCKDKWKGILCKRKHYVHGIHLPNMSLSGIIDVDALSNITSLVSLVLENNSFEGRLPAVNKLKTLKVIDLHQNKFSGNIPGDFFRGTRFRRIWLSENGFTGKIPESLASIKSLLYLHLEKNKFSGPILELPQNLTELDMSDNQLEGEVPASMVKYGRKAFEGNPRVCGKVMPSECPTPTTPTTKGAAKKTKQPRKLNSKSIILIVSSIVGVMVVSVVLLFVVKSRRKEDGDANVHGNRYADNVVEVRVHGDRAPSGGASTKQSSGGGGGGGYRKGSQMGKQMGDLIVINNEKGIFGLGDLMEAAAEVLGNGALGSAYKAVMSNGVSVVVKRIKDMNNLGKEEFDIEIRKLGKLRNKNILTPLAYQYKKEEKLVISEYISNGSLLYVIHGDRGQRHEGLNWPNRLKVIKGIVSGLQYLHSEFPSYTVPHGNLKSSNVLLNENYEPLLSDYAFIHMVTPAQASQGMFSYKSPEVVEGKQVSIKSDIYCLGIIILEVLTGKFPTQYLNAGNGGTDVIQWVQSSINDKNEGEILDPGIASTSHSVDSMIQLLHLGAACCSNNPDERPSLEETTIRLDKIQA